jgi:RNA polymerase-interacting CarD/CdnL/TRCF family regulator
MNIETMSPSAILEQWDKEYIEEKFFNFGIFNKKNNNPKVLYTVQYKNLSKGSKVDYVFINETSAKISLMSTIKSICNGNIDINDDKIIIKSRYKKDYDEYLNNKIFIYSVNNIKYNDTNARSIDSASIDELIFSGTVQEAIDKYNINIEISDTSKIEKERKQIFNMATKYAKNSLDNVFKKYPEYKKRHGFSLVYKDDDNYERFISGEDKYLPLIYCDAWNFTNNKARDDSEYEIYNKALSIITKELSETIKNDNKLYSIGTIEYTGDWDDGTIDFELKINH